LHETFIILQVRMSKATQVLENDTVAMTDHESVCSFVFKPQNIGQQLWKA